MASLIFSIEKDNDIVVPVVGTVTLGRADGNDVLVDDASISATHAEVSQSEQGYLVKDLGSRSGTFVNGKRVRSHSLVDGDLVSFGALRGRFVLDDAEKKTARRPSQESKARARQTEAGKPTQEDAAARHQALLSTLKELGDEEARRRANLEQLQQEVTAAEAALASLRAGIATATTGTVSGDEGRLKTAVSELQAKHDTLVSSLATVERAVADMERRHADGVAGLRDREEKLRRTAKDIDEATVARGNLQSELKELAIKREALDAEMEQLAVRVRGIETRLTDLAVLAQAREDQVHAAEQRLQQVEQRRRELDQHIEAQATTEASVLQAKRELEKLTAEHAALQALLAGRDEKLAELRSAEARLAAIATMREEAERQLAAEKDSVEKYRTEAGLARARSEAELLELEKQCALEREKLTRAGQQLRDTIARNEDLQTQNRKLEGIEGKLREARTLLSQTVTRQAEVEAKSAAIEKEHQEGLAKLGRLQAEIRAVEKSIESLKGEESTVKEAIQELRAMQAAEQRRVDEMDKLVAETEAQAAVHRARLDAMMEQRRRELAELESRCEMLRTLHEDIDERYQKLATLKPGSPEALALWQSAQEKKEEVMDSVSHGEGGIRARPQVRTVLVPRVREN